MSWTSSWGHSRLRRVGGRAIRSLAIFSSFLSHKKKGGRDELEFSFGFSTFDQNSITPMLIAMFKGPGVTVPNNVLSDLRTHEYVGDTFVESTGRRDASEETGASLTLDVVFDHGFPRRCLVHRHRQSLKYL